MASTKKYLYCVIKKPENFSISIGGLEGKRIYLINDEKLSAVISDFDAGEAGVTRKNLLAHDEVVNKVLASEKAVVPASFGTIIKNEDEIREKFLFGNREKLTEALECAKGKAEVKVKADFPDILDAVRMLVMENENLKKIHEEIQGKNLSFPERVELGQIIEKELYKKRLQIKNKVLAALAGKYLEYKEKEIIGEKGIFDLIFLVELDKERELILALQRLEDEIDGEKIVLNYSGPTASYNFINLPLSF